MLLSGKHPPCSVQIPNSDLSFPREGIGRAVSINSGFGWAAKGSLLGSSGWLCFCHFSLCTSYLGSESKPGQVQDDSLLGVAQSNQGGWLAPLCPREQRAGTCRYELRNRNSRPLK